MSTNYYLTVSERCPHCNEVIKEEELHIGLSAFGWAFSLHGIRGKASTLAEWRNLFDQGVIKDEYGTALTAVEMEEIITCRAGFIAPANKVLQRHKVSSDTVVDPCEDYDVCFYEFS